MIKLVIGLKISKTCTCYVYFNFSSLNISVENHVSDVRDKS